MKILTFKNEVEMVGKYKEEIWNSEWMKEGRKEEMSK